jgi:hypothetical protein
MDDYYYTLNVLKIYYNEIDYLHFVLDKQKSNYYCHCDEDELSYDQEVLENRKKSLIVYKNPIIIYDKPNFNKLLCEQKYKHIVESLINEHDKKWNEVTKIIKIEEKIEPNRLTFNNGRYQIKD